MSSAAIDLTVDLTSGPRRTIQKRFVGARRKLVQITLREGELLAEHHAVTPITIHCVAGDATGIILAATITALLGLPMIVDIAVEYIVGFGIGLKLFSAP